MREIKFRFWNERQKRFEYWGFISGYFQSIPSGYSIKRIIGNSEQYTGLKDKNGKEWFEGDMTDEENGVFGIVVFEEGTFSFAWYELCERGGSEYIETCPMTHYHYDSMQLIGNIHENPELLK